MTGNRPNPLAAAPTDAGGRIYDLLVIGGGITGAGIAWRAAQVERSVLLVEANDFAAGTSSRSTKLIHGGLRYLARGELALVRDGVRERHRLHSIAPHLVEPGCSPIHRSRRCAGKGPSLKSRSPWPVSLPSSRHARLSMRRDPGWKREESSPVAGGKLTGFRMMADPVLRTLGISPSPTVPLLPGGDFDDRNALVRDLVNKTGDPILAERLVTRYGSEAGTLLSLGDAPLSGSRAILTGEVAWGATVEGAQTIEDLVYRRVRLAIFSPQTLRGILPAVAEQMRRHRNWTDAETRAQLAAVTERLRCDLDFHQGS